MKYLRWNRQFVRLCFRYVKTRWETWADSYYLFKLQQNITTPKTIYHFEYSKKKQLYCMKQRFPQNSTESRKKWNCLVFQTHDILNCQLSVSPVSDKFGGWWRVKCERMGARTVRHGDETGLRSSHSEKAKRTETNQLFVKLSTIRQTWKYLYYTAWEHLMLSFWAQRIKDSIDDVKRVKREHASSSLHPTSKKH